MEVNDENNWKTMLFPEGIVLQHCWLVHNSLFEQIFNQEETYMYFPVHIERNMTETFDGDLKL